MRVLHVIESLEIGGAERVVVDLANAQVEQMPVGVCCVKTHGSLCTMLDPRVAVYCLDKGEGNDLRLPERLASLVREGGYTIIHSHGWGVFVESAFARKRLKLRRVIHTVHGNYLTYPSGLLSPIKRLLRRILERLAVRYYDAVVAVSDAAGRYVADHLDLHDGKVVTIHNGIRSEPKAAVRRTGKKIVFITAGRLADVKNQALMLRAFERIARQLPQSELRLVGDGPMREALVSEAQSLGISDRVHFTGFSRNVEAELAKAHVFLLTSHYEGISIALLEAMRASLPVIATRVGGMTETVKDGVTGILIDDNDEEALVAAMLRLAGSPEDRVAMGERGLALLRSDFSIGTTVAKYVALYRDGLPAGTKV